MKNENKQEVTKSRVEYLSSKIEERFEEKLPSLRKMEETDLEIMVDLLSYM